MKRLRATTRYWQEWVRGLAIPFEWQAETIRAAITLQLCTYDDNGSVLAAPTTSIPEAPDSGRNWDYRYCWLRDAYFTVQALNRLGATGAMEAFLRYLDDVVARARGTTAAAGLRHHRRGGAERALGRDARRGRGHGAGARRQSRLPAAPARCLRLGDPRLHADLLR